MASVHPAVLLRLTAVVARPDLADPLVSVWLRRFGSFADRQLRRAVLGELLEETDDASLLGVLLRLDERSRAGDAPCRALTAELALTPSVLHDLPYARTAELYEAARAAGLERLARRFLGQDTGEGNVAPQNPHFEASPGERTAAARGTDRLVLDRLLHDRDPRVIAALLDNPRIIERDVVRIAAMRPTSPAILGLVAAHRRWGAQYRVRKALAFNPASPIALARPLLPTLLRQDLTDLAGSQVLSAELREEVRAILDP